MAKNLVNGTNIIIEENGDNINMNLSSDYSNSLNNQLTNINNSITTKTTYSTTETVVGTWINNKPIYRKIVARNITATNHTTISLSSLNIDELLTVKSINKKVSDDSTFFDNFFDSSNEKITLHYRNDIIEFWTATGTNYTSTVWIEYTKTTD